MRFLRRSLVGIFLISLTVGLFAWAGNIFYGALQVRWNEEAGGPPARERVFAANVMTVEAQTIAPTLTSFGEIRSRRTLDLRATASGAIVELAENFEEGGTVTAGQLLARINPADAQAALERAKTDLHTAEAELRDAEGGIDLVNDELASSEAQASLRELALARQQNLLDRGVGTEAALEVAKLAASSANQVVLSQRKSVANATARLDQATTSLARAKIDVAEATRAVAETEIYADFTGTLADVNVVQGGLVANNEKLAEIVDAGALEVAFRVSTPQYVRLLNPEGQLMLSDIQVSLDILGVDLTTKGKITRESAAVGEGQTGRLLFARIDDAKGFRPGDFATVAIKEPELDNVALLPVTAVDSASTVLIVGDDDRLEVASVRILRRQENDVIIDASGIAGRQIVTERSPLLGGGIRVRPIQPKEDGAPEAEPSPQFVKLTPERRAKLVAFVEKNKFMPADAKERVLGQLNQDEVPAGVVERIESRMGG